MKAVVYTRYGGPDVLRLADADTPVPGDGQVLVKVHAVSLNASDWEALRGKPLYARIGGLFRPRHHVLGSDRRALLPGGRYLYVGGSVATLLQALAIGPVIGGAGRKKIRLLAVRLGVQHLDPLVELIRAGQVTTVIDRRFALSEVPQALRYLGDGHAKGKVVVTVG